MESRRTLLVRTFSFAGVAILMGRIAGGIPRPAAAQDETISHGGTTGHLLVSPEAAAVQAATADALAERGFARIQAAASLAEAASDGETIAAGAVAVATADPDTGAVAQGAEGTAIAITARELAVAPAKIRPTRVRRERRPRKVRGARRQRRVKTLPGTGVGNAAQSASPWLGLTSALAAAGAYVLRRRGGDSPTTRANAIDEVFVR
jgi:hypothetical protein